MITRRQALRVAAGAVLAARHSFSPAQAQTPAAGMGIGTACYAQRFRADREKGANNPLSDTLAFLEYCHNLGAGGIQAGLSSTETGYAKRLRRLADDYGMYVEVSVSLPRDQSDLQEFQQTVRAAKGAGATVLRAVALNGRRYETFDSATAFQQFAVQSWKSLAMVEPILRKNRVRLALENHKDWRIDELLGMLKRLSSEFVGICVDTGNNIALLEDPVELAEAFAPYAYAVQLKDMAVEEYEQGLRLSEVPLGEGFLDLKRIVQVLRQGQPGVRFTLEMITRDPLEIPFLTNKYWATFDNLPGRDMARTLALVRGHQREKALARISHLNLDEQVSIEDDNVRKCLAYAGTELGL